WRRPQLRPALASLSAQKPSRRGLPKRQNLHSRLLIAGGVGGGRGTASSSPSAPTRRGGATQTVPLPLPAWGSTGAPGSNLASSFNAAHTAQAAHPIAQTSAASTP